MVDILQIIFYLTLISVMCIAANMMWKSKKLIERQLELVEHQMKPYQPDFKEK